jgi:pimeloyl-ACP methyl ester carboxylesterase
VVLLPGWGVSAFTYRHQLPALGAAGYRAIAVDLKGHGFSDKPTGPDEYTSDAMRLHAAEVIDAVARGPAVIVAQSMAGPLGIELARDRGTVTALVLVSPVGLGLVPFIRLAQFLTPRFVDAVAPHLARRWIVHWALGVAYGDSARVTDDIVDEYWAPAQVPGFARALRALVHDFAWSPLPDEWVAAVGDRTLLILGERDRLVRGGQQRARKLLGSRAVVISGAGHTVHEERPEPVNAAILDFLRRLPV